MLLDVGIAYVYRVDGQAQRTETSVTGGLTQVYHNWYGTKSHAAEDNETGDVVRKIRIPRAPVLVGDIVTLAGTAWVVSHAYEADDEDNGLPITDLTLISGQNVFVPAKLYPRTETVDDYNARQGNPDLEQETFVWCMRRSVENAEYYDAQMAGIALDMRIDVYAAEYAGQSYALVDGVMYSVERRTMHGVMQRLYLSAVDGMEGG